ALAEDTGRPLMVMTHNMFAAQKIADDLQEALSPDQVLLYPANELVAAEAAISSPETLSQRIDVLIRCAQGFRGIVVVPFSGVRRLLPIPETWREARIELKEGETIQLEAFLLHMVEMGYQRV
ncbi:transcription-repair coupling factor, partial [Bacillus cereus]|nr:transcription-repair coupling factor [Bacillus cereus]